MSRRVNAHGRHSGWSRLSVGLLTVVGLVAAALVASGAAAASKQPHSSAASTKFAAACGTRRITLQGYFESGFPDINDLTAAFTKQYPSVKWHIREDPFATITQDAPLTLGVRTRLI